jgi:cytochrome c oxidase cbb3-type subunit I/II
MTETVHVVYDDRTARRFLWASVVFALVAMLAGLVAAVQLAFHQANLPPWFNFGRLRPLHTNAAIFAFVGNMIFAGIYHSTQRLLKTRMASDVLSAIHFWGWQLVIVLAAVTLPLGITTSKEYAELEWPIDLLIAVVWVVFAVNYFWTLARRNEKNLYVAIWFYIATIITVAVLHVVNSLELPVSPWKSYSVFAGAQDALVQWWYGHNAVAFFLTTPVLGIMYYYLPKAADRPVYSYRLSIIHFWALIFVYIWAGPHHLLNTALPDWTQTLGMIFSVMLWAPSWGGMINGLLTLRGGWDQLREDPVLKFFAAGVTFYGMATFEGPLLAIKSVSGLAHYTDWIIGHVHSGALGWNGFMAAGMFYWMVPRLYGKPLHSKAAANAHFYIGTAGILIYVVAMWVSGITQGMMWRAMTPQGALEYPAFLETLLAIRPMYLLRILGGGLYLAGMLIMVWNLVKTMRAGGPVEVGVDVVREPADTTPWTRIVFAPPVVVSGLVVVVGLVSGFVQAAGALGLLLLAGTAGIAGGLTWKISTRSGWHRLLEGRPLLFTALSAIAVLIGGVVEIVPSLVAAQAGATASRTRPYTALELEGRDVYVREGCYVCHSQMIRPMRFETLRYGERSTMDDSVWDHPFQWGSKRTGPDLARIGRKYPSLWHAQHLIDPRSTSPGSNMPPYAFLVDGKVDFGRTGAKLDALSRLGVPYSDAQIDGAGGEAQAQAKGIADELAQAGVAVPADSEMVALIAYLQSLGQLAPLPDDTVAEVAK